METLKKIVKSIRPLRDFYFEHFGKLPLVYEFSDLTPEYYKKIKTANDMELEHQIGRLTNFKAILTEIEENKLAGEILEFGTWRGFSTLWIAYLCQKLGIFDKKIISFDGFTGLPEAEGVFEKNAFDDTSLTICRNNIAKSREVWNAIKGNIFIETNLYSEKSEIIDKIKKITDKKFVFIHIDCDITSSALEIFDILIEGDLISDTSFILFDDYGFATGIKTAADIFFDSIRDRFEVREYSHTKLTKNFKLVKKGVAHEKTQ